MSETLQIVRPGILSSYGSLSTTPVQVTVEAAALFQLLEFSLRSEDGSRIIGTLLGTRSDDGSEIVINDAYIVPHHEEGDSVTIEEYHHKVQYRLHKKSNPTETIIGWFSTTNGIDSFTSLVHDFYSRGADGTHPYPAIHLTLDSSSEIKDIPIINTYIASPIGAVGPTASALNIEKSGSYVFSPVINNVKFNAQDKSVLKYASNNVYKEVDSSKLNSKSVDLELLVEHLNQVDALITSTVAYIEKIENGEVKGDDKFAKFLLSNLKTNVNKVNLEELENSFKAHIQDTLMLEYLASSVKTQLDLAAKLTTLTN